MLLTLTNFASAVQLYSHESMSFTKENNANINLSKLEKSASDLAIEKQMVDEDGMIPVFIVMEGASVLDTNALAVLNQTTLNQMQQLKAKQDVVVSKIEKSVGQDLVVTDNYTWLFNGVATSIPYSAMDKIAAMDGVSKVIVQPIYELYKETSPKTGASLFTNSDGVI